MDSSVWDRFAFKGVICFTGYPDRAKRCAEEFARVGLSGVETFWFPSSAYEDALKRIVPLGSYMKNAKAAVAITLHHYNVAKVFLERGARHAIIFEDDVRFLLDVSAVQEAIRTLPDDYDVAWLDMVPSQQARKSPDFVPSVEAAKVEGAPAWRRARGWFRSCCAYALSRRGLEAYVALLERGAHGEELCVCDRHLAWLADPKFGMRGYVARPNVAVQAIPRNGACNTGNDVQREGYSILGVDRTLYAHYEEDEP